MKPFGKTSDGVIDNLLRAYVSRTNPQQACPEFDPDLATAYIERSLTPGLRLHYEEHLSECAACRKNVAALVRLADPVDVASLSGRDKNRAASPSVARRIFGALSRPQWAMATAALIVLAISIPVLLSRNAKFEKQLSEPSAAVAPAGENAQSTGRLAGAAQAPSAKPQAEESSTSGAANSKQREKRETETAATTPASARNAVVPGRAGGAAEPQKTNAKSAPQSADETRSAEGQAATKQPSQTAAAPESQVAKNDSDKGRQQQGKESTQQSAEAKQDRADEPRDKEKAARAEEAAPPPTASTSEVARARGGLKRGPAKLSLRDSAGEAVRPSERKISNKKFLFRDNTWTDKEFDPNKDLPVVTIIRDSNVYKEVLAKRAGLRPYLTAFETERAIIVYKGTVYKLIPQ